MVAKKAGDGVAERLPMITIGVPTYNRAWCLPRFLDTVEKLDYPKDKIRIVFVDNYSEDETISLLKGFKERLGDVYEGVVIVTEKSNIPEARNACLRNSVGEYVLFLDTDVLSPPETIKRMLEVFASNPKAAIVGFPYRSEPPTLAENMYFSKQPRTPHAAAVIGTGCTMIKRRIFEEIGTFDSEYMADEDADLTVRASKAGYIALLDPTRTPLHLTRERLPGIFQQIVEYSRYSFGPLARYHFMILQRHKPRWMRNKVIFYLAMGLSIPIALIGIALWNVFLVLPFVLLYGVAFAYHFPKASGKWRIINAVVFPLFGMCFALGILREVLKSRLT